MNSQLPVVQQLVSRIYVGEHEVIARDRYSFEVKLTADVRVLTELPVDGIAKVVRHDTSFLSGGTVSVRKFTATSGCGQEVNFAGVAVVEAARFVSPDAAGEALRAILIRIGQGLDHVVAIDHQPDRDARLRLLASLGRNGCVGAADSLKFWLNHQASILVEDLVTNRVPARSAADALKTVAATLDALCHYLSPHLDGPPRAEWVLPRTLPDWLQLARRQRVAQS